jgi:hypothetical protein
MENSRVSGKELCDMPKKINPQLLLLKWDWKNSDWRILKEVKMHFATLIVSFITTVSLQQSELFYVRKIILHFTFYNN